MNIRRKGNEIIRIGCMLGTRTDLNDDVEHSFTVK